MIQEQDTTLNFYSENRLSENALNFLEEIKFQPYDLQSYDKFKLINYVNSNPYLLKNLFNSYFEVGFCEEFPLEYSNENNEKYNYFYEINQKRKSTRKYSENPMSFNELSDFLRIFYRVTGNEKLKVKEQIIDRKIRNIASGGGVYPTEIYIINNKIKEISQGLYHYNILDKKLELLKDFSDEKNRTEFYENIMFNQNKESIIDFNNTSAFILFTSVLNKVTSKYLDFGLVLSLIEIGQFVHSAYLSASVMDLACCPFGGILNDNMKKFINTNNPLHHPVIAMTLGKMN